MEDEAAAAAKAAADAIAELDAAMAANANVVAKKLVSGRAIKSEVTRQLIKRIAEMDMAERQAVKRPCRKRDPSKAPPELPYDYILPKNPTCKDLDHACHCDMTEEMCKQEEPSCRVKKDGEEECAPLFRDFCPAWCKTEFGVDKCVPEPTEN